MVAPLIEKPVRVRRQATNREMREALKQIQQVLHECSERDQMGSNGHLCNECANEIQRLADNVLRLGKST